MRRTITTFLLLCILLCSAIYLSRLNHKKEQSFNLSYVPDINNEIKKRYQNYVDEIEKYRIGTPFQRYNNPNSPYSNDYRLHPQSFIPDYRQPIDSIVPDDYPSTLPSANSMFPEMNNPNCNPNVSGCMDMQNGYYVDFLNKCE